MDGRPGRLVGACLTDQQADGLSMIYSFFEPDSAGRTGLGTYIILDHIVRAAAAGLPYVYLGYWVEEAKRMAYKTRFRPLERLGPGGWRRFDPAPWPSSSCRDGGAGRGVSLISLNATTPLSFPLSRESYEKRGASRPA